MYLGQDYYNQVYDDLINNKILTEKQTEAVLAERGIWSSDKQKMLDDLTENLKKLRKELPNVKFRSAAKKEIECYIDVTEKKIKELLGQKHCNIQQTAEYIANIEKYKYLLFLLAKDVHGNKIWTDFKEYSETDNNLLNNIIFKSFFDKNLNEKNIRELARNEPWRSTWLSAVKTGNLFPFSKTEMTEYQKGLVTWSIVYDNVYESMDCPSDDIIHDDDLLDQWFIETAEKRKKERGERGSLTLNNDRISKAQEVGIVVDSLEDAQKVYNLNSNSVLNDLKKDQEVIKTKGEVSVANLPSVRKNLKIQANKLSQEGIKNRHG